MIQEGISNVLDAIRLQNTQLFFVSGNIFDYVSVGQKNEQNFLSFLEKITARKYPNFIVYDLFSGITPIRMSEAVKQLLNPETKQAESGPAKKDNKYNRMIAEAMGNHTDDSEKKEDVISKMVAFHLFDKLFTKQKDKPTIEPIILVINFAYSIVSQTLSESQEDARAMVIALQKWSQSKQIEESGHMIFLLTNNHQDIDARLFDKSGRIKLIYLKKPSEEERFDFLIGKQIEEKKAQLIARNSSGTTLKELERIISTTTDMPADQILQLCFLAKKEAIEAEYGDLLQVCSPRFGFEVIGGLENLVKKFQEIAFNMREGKTSLVPQGILLMGPPGTGKSLFAESYAKEAGINYFKVLDIKNMWVGSSERNASRLFNAIREAAPVVVFIDEFDQNQGQRGGFDGDSGVSRNLFKKLAEFVGDTSLRGKVLWLFATNRPDLIDPALKRPGRCDLRIPILRPDVHRLVQICERVPKEYPEIQLNVKRWKSLVKDCDGYSGADMVEIVRIAWELANESGRDAIIDGDVKDAIKDFKPQEIDEVEMAQMTLVAIRECSRMSLLPENVEKIINNCSSIIKGKIQETLGDDNTSSTIQSSSANPNKISN